VEPQQLGSLKKALSSLFPSEEGEGMREGSIDINQRAEGIRNLSEIAQREIQSCGEGLSFLPFDNECSVCSRPGFILLFFDLKTNGFHSGTLFHLLQTFFNY
jgi:hypothetical protein